LEHKNFISKNNKHACLDALRETFVYHSINSNKEYSHIFPHLLAVVIMDFELDTLITL
jgi:hypothetical protein